MSRFSHLNVIFRPFERWPQEDQPRKTCRGFRSTYSDTLNKLEKELRFLKANQAVIQLNLEPDQIRNDGLPRSGSRPDHPGVILSFESKFGPLQYFCTQFTDWESNLRGITLTLERLRMAELYGVAKRGEQYKGWAALPDPNRPFSTRDEALRWLSAFTNESLALKTPDALVRIAIKKSHPDLGGLVTDFAKVQAARALVEAETGS